MHDSLYPFTAIVGQEKLKKAILLNLICPEIGGVLLSGQKGTAKSTIVRSITHLMKGLKVHTVPLNATEDRVLGSLNIEIALMEGKIEFEAGLLYQANDGILYIDEVNLLSDAITNLILEVSSMHVNRVEREGLSYSHDSNFILLGSMNPEEGYLKPQLLDRFGFYVEIEGSNILAERIEIINRRLEFESNPNEFISKFQENEEKLFHKITTAKDLLKSVSIPDSLLTVIAKLCSEAFVSGHRGDISLTLGAKANAAFDGRKIVSMKDIQDILDLALIHRYRTPPSMMEQQDDNHNEDQSQNEAQENTKADTSEPENTDSDTAETETKEESDLEDKNDLEDELENQELDAPLEFEEEYFDIDENFVARDILSDLVSKRLKVQGSGRRTKTLSNSKMGRYIKYKLPKGKITDIAFDATLRNAAPHQKSRKKSDLLISIKCEDIREKIREKRIGNLIMFLVDASGSMGIDKRMREAKGAVFSLLQDAYQKRDTVGLITFRGNEAEVILNPTRSIDLAVNRLQKIQTGGKTPLALGVKTTVDFIKSKKAKDNNIVPIVVIISDGRGNVSMFGKKIITEIEEISKAASKENVDFVVLDTETGFLKLGLAKKMADQLGALYLRIEDLREGELVDAIKQVVSSRLPS